ncbi:hypothetical protein CK203_049148 [Vitis vinifera]|uniref:Uncharacterized protein n=1 Tax=Vitis vinifera TaxID=29760 RepID=A0A438GV80_VITVI|nr:hypothetical protein CK203_049148 [Vitis vinifera]
MIGSKNVSRFKRLADACARRNLLTKVRVDEVTLIVDEEIKVGVCRTYHTLLSETGDWRLSIRGLHFKALGEDRSKSLVVLVSEEVFEALSSLSDDKALGWAVETLEDVASMLGCRVDKLPTSYLGLPSGASFKSSRMWDAIEERFRKRFNNVEKAIPLYGWEAYLDQKHLIKSPDLFHVSFCYS